MDKLLININTKHKWSYWKTRTSWEDVQNILQIHGKVPELPTKSPMTETPQQFEKTYKRKTVESTSKDSGTEEERSTKRQKMEALDEEEDPELQEEVAPVDKGPVVIVEVSSSEKPKSTEGQSEIESGSTDQVKQIDHVHHFMDIRKMGAKIKKTFSLKYLNMIHLKPE
jgi:hypothetical protein